MKVAITDCSHCRLQNNVILKPFDCGDSDLNNFLFEDAHNYSSQLLAVTYLFKYRDKTAAYYSLFNDKISFEDKTVRNRFSRACDIPNTKRMSHYPAVKIGRLAVSQEFSNNGIGRGILDMVKYLFSTNNRTGCRFVTVDAYRAALSFYEKNGFEYLTSTDTDEATRLMYFDLKQFAS